MASWNAVVLAGDRGPTDPVAQAAHVSGKALVEFEGQTLLQRIVTVLIQAKSVDQIFVVGPSENCLNNTELISFLKKNKVIYLPPEKGPSASALKGILSSDSYPTIVVTCDLPLLDAQQIDNYCQSMQRIDADFVVTAVNYSAISEDMPSLKKTKYKFGDREVCFANIFAVLREPGLKAIHYWQDIESSRKKPIEIIRKIDWLSILRYKLGLLTLDETAKRLSEKVGAKLSIKNSDQANLAIDVDSKDDYEVFLEYFKNKN